MVNKLSWPGEVFYRRLMSILDDYGRCDARTPILRSELYPLRLDKVAESDIVKWISECEKAGLIRIYTVDSKPYIELFNFGQTVRIKKARFPAPLTCKQMQSDASNGVSETETETETETNSAARVIPFDPLDRYPDGQTAFEDIKNNEVLMTDLIRIFHNNGFKAANGVHVMVAVKKFMSIEAPKDDFKIKSKGQVKSHLINWLNKNAKQLGNG